MFAILQSILLLIHLLIAQCCTQLSNNELIVVSKVNETITLNVRDLFIKDDLSQIILSSDGSDMFLQNRMSLHSKVNNSFNQIINAKVLRSDHDFSSLNQYVLLDQNTKNLELYYSDKQFFGSKARLPNFTSKILIEKYQCHDLDFIQQGTIILDCYESMNNVFLIYSNEYGLEIFQDEGQLFDPQSKRSIVHFQNNLMIRVVFYDDLVQQSVIQIYELQQNDGRKFQLVLTINDDFLQNLFEDQNLQLKILQFDVLGTIFSLLNKDSWFCKLDLSAFPQVKPKQFLRLKYSESIISFAIHNTSNILTFQSLNHLYTIYNKTEFNKTVDNANGTNKIYFSKNFFILQQQQKISIYTLKLKHAESINTESSVLILDQFEDEIIVVNKDFSGRIMLNIDKYLIFKSSEIISEFKYATLMQQFSFIDYCILTIKLLTVSLNSTKMIPTKMNELDVVLNNLIEYFQIPSFISGPNITYLDINQEKTNNVTISINFEQIMLQNIGIFQQGTPIYSKALQMNNLILYLVQLTNRDLYFYYCYLPLICTQQNIVKLDFYLSQTEHQAFVYNTYFSYIVVKNNQQLDVFFLEYSTDIKYQCTIYPDQDETIIHFVYLNGGIAVLQSTDILILYSIECVKQQMITKELFKQDQIDWHPTYLHANQDFQLLLIKSNDQILVVKVNQKYTTFIDLIQLSFDSQIEIFSSPKTFWVYYINTTIIESYNWESIINIYFQTQVYLYNFVPNKFINHPQSQYIYFYQDSDNVKNIYSYDMYSSSHNSLITVLNVNASIFCSFKNHLIIGDSNTYYQMPIGINFSVLYKNIFNTSQVIRVNTSISIEGIDKQEVIQYPMYSGLVNPYTKIIINTDNLNLTGLVNLKKPVGFCQEKYSWYSGQVTDVAIKSQQLQIIKPWHLQNTNVSLAGFDMKYYGSQTFLIVKKDCLIKFDYENKVQQIQDLKLNYTFPSILLIKDELIFVKNYKDQNYTVNVVQCSIEFNCFQIGDILTAFVVKYVKTLNDLYFFIGQSTINVYTKQQSKFNLIGQIQASNQAGFYEIAYLQQSIYQIYLIKDNILNINTYEIESNKIKLLSNQSIDILETLKYQGVFVDPQTRIVKLLIKQIQTQQEVFSAELLLQSYSHSHYLLWLIQICKLTDPINCIINKTKILQIYQAYGGWSSNKIEIYNQQYLLMQYQQGQTYLEVIYRMQPEYFKNDLESTLFIGAVQHNYINYQQTVFFNENQKTFLLTNINDETVYSLYEINNTTKFCITSNLVSETIKIGLKNNFDQVDCNIEITSDDDSKIANLSVGWIIFWIVMGFLVLLGIGALFLCCCKYGKKQENLFIEI